jgi:hypothetical protein
LDTLCCERGWLAQLPARMPQNSKRAHRPTAGFLRKSTNQPSP